MRTIQAGSITLLDFEPSDDFRGDVLAGLSEQPKRIPCKYFYDQRGSELFEQITELGEYYPTRTELLILDAHVGEMADWLAANCRLVEFGSGSSLKTRLLLQALDSPASYVPIDISREHLLASAQAIQREFPGLLVQPVCADYTKDYHLPDPPRASTSTVVYFPGSTIGNFTPDASVVFLRRVAQLAGKGGGLLLGADLKKDKAILDAAYDDARGITAEFNLNLLARCNRELAADFDLEAFRHVAFYDPEPGRIEMHLESVREQVARVAGQEFAFEAGERILTEYSHKYSCEDLGRLAAEAGLAVERTWTDPDQMFAVLGLRVG